MITLASLPILARVLSTISHLRHLVLVEHIDDGILSNTSNDIDLPCE